MRETLVIIIAVAIGFLLYSLYFSPDSSTSDQTAAPVSAIRRCCRSQASLR